MPMLRNGPIRAEDLVLTQPMSANAAIRLMKRLGAEKIHGKWVLSKTAAIDFYLRNLDGETSWKSLISVFGPSTRSVLFRKVLELEKAGILERDHVDYPMRQVKHEDRSRGPRVLIRRTRQ